MASTMSPHYLSLALAPFGNDVINEALNNYSCYGIYVGMIRPKSKARIVSRLGEKPLTYYRLDRRDEPLIKETLRQQAKLLFSSGAIKLFLPIYGSKPAHNLEQVDALLQKMPVKRFEITSMHVMASCPMGEEDASISVVDQQGRLKGFDNLYITDASVLPSNIGESPQGTIMAFANEIITRHLS